MKRFIGMLISVMFIHAAHADDTAYIQLQIESALHDKATYVCVTNAGCLNLAKSSHMKPFPMEAGSIDNIVIANMAKHTMYAQQLPASCSNLTVKNGQTLLVAGEMNSDNTRINNLHCAIS